MPVITGPVITGPVTAVPVTTVPVTTVPVTTGAGAAGKGVRTLGEDAALVGSIGVLTIATRGSAGPGEVRVSIRGGSETFIAWSAEPLPRGSTVLVIESHGTRSVHVSAWSDPVRDFPAG